MGTRGAGLLSAILLSCFLLGLAEETVSTGKNTGEGNRELKTDAVVSFQDASEVEDTRDVVYQKGVENSAVIDENKREGKQFGRGRVHLSRLEQGPLTLQGGKLRPVGRLNGPSRLPPNQRGPPGARLGGNRRQGGHEGARRQSILPLQPLHPRPPLPSLRPPGSPLKPQQTPQKYFPSDNVPFRYNQQPAIPEVHMTRLKGQGLGPDSPSENFNNFHGEKGEPGLSEPEAQPSSVKESIAVRPYPGRPIRAEVLDDWSAKVAQSTDGKQTVLLDTKYFSLTYPEESEVTSAPPIKVVTGRPGLVLRKVKGRMKTSTEQSLQSTSTAARVTVTDLCHDPRALLECDDQHENMTSVVKTGTGPASSIATYKELLKHFKKEVWVIPVLIAAGIIILILTIYEIFLLAKAVNKNPSRRHLFLGQMLLLGLLACSAMAVVYTLKPTTITCAVIRLGSGLAYSLVYSTLLVKLVFLISLNSGVYLPATYQSLLLSFAILIQLVIGVQWLVSAPPELVEQVLAPNSKETWVTCATAFNQQLLGLLYVVFLIVVVVLLSFKSRGVRENYREAMYVGLTIGFTVAIWMVWILAGFIVPTRYQDVCSACGLIACTSITFVIMFMPKGRQLSAMGREGVYAEDRTDVYTGTGSGTGSTGSSGTPSPSFFPVKPGKLGVDLHRQHYREKEREYKERLPERERLDTPPAAHKHLQLFGQPDHRQSIRDKFDSRQELIRQQSQRVRSESPRQWVGRNGSDLYGRGRSYSPRASHLYGHPLFRSSHGDLVRASQRQRDGLPRFASHRDLSNSDPVRSSRQRQAESGRGREILATISPRRLQPCARCLPGQPGHSSGRHDDNIYTSLEALNHSERFPYKSQPSRHNPNVLFRRPNDMPPGFMY